MAAGFVLAVATDGKVGLMGKGGEKVEFPAPVGLVHLLPELAREGGPGAIIGGMLRLLDEFGAGGKVGEPDVVVIELREVLLADSTRRPAYGAEAKSFAGPTRTTEANDGDGHG